MKNYYRLGVLGLTSGLAFSALAQSTSQQNAAQPLPATGAQPAGTIQLAANASGDLLQELQEIVVTARRREEVARDVPIPLSVISGDTLEDKSIFNVNRLTESQPSLQLFTSNPRNTAINIRGFGAPFGLTNDGLEPGVGVYVDEVFHARPATATFDFIDTERIEILRGPQGTLYGKNTTAGAINLHTRDAGFTPEGAVEVSYGNYNFQQARAYLNGPITDKLAGRLSFASTSRDGVLRNINTNDDVNDMNNLGLRSQLRYEYSDDLTITLRGDFNKQRLECCTQVFVGVAPTQRPENRQFAAIAADLNYAPASTNPFDRVTAVDTPLQANQDIGGASVHVEWSTAAGSFTSVSACA
ncbi:MAG: TonB-dependent receptor [Pseudomonadales bacterium]|nr:TonB-dependent receptor [Pseudomonadales bacterium]